MNTVNLPIPLRSQASTEPIVVMFLRWHRENRKAIYDLASMVILGIITFVPLFIVEFTEFFFAFTRKYEHIQLEEIIITLLFVLAFYLPIFSVRRWADSVNLLRQANTDSLTELLNRRRGWEILEYESARATRHNRPLSIIIFDIDHFKNVNDKYGHLVGDRVLMGVAKAAVGKIRKIDTLMRWGGEEFMIVCSETNNQGAYQLAERLRKEIESYNFHDHIQVTASFGISEWKQTDSLESFVKRADDNVYQAKAAGRNKVAQ